MEDPQRPLPPDDEHCMACRNWTPRQFLLVCKWCGSGPYCVSYIPQCMKRHVRHCHNNPHHCCVAIPAQVHSVPVPAGSVLSPNSMNSANLPGPEYLVLENDAFPIWEDYHPDDEAGKAAWWKRCREDYQRTLARMLGKTIEEIMDLTATPRRSTHVIVGKCKGCIKLCPVYSRCMCCGGIACGSCRYDTEICNICATKGEVQA